MNLDDEKNTWKQEHDDLAAASGGLRGADLVARAAKLETAIWRRDLIEAVAAAFVVLFFGACLWLMPMPPLMQLGIAIIALGAIEIVVVMNWTRRRDARLNRDLPLMDFCAAEIKRVDRQVWLLRHVSWWYSSPILIGALVLIYGMMSPLQELSAFKFFGFLAAFFACFLATGFIVHRHNARAIKSDLLPIRNELVDVKRSLDDDASESGGR